MALSDLIKGKGSYAHFATVTPATFETEELSPGLTVASVATVSVATPLCQGLQSSERAAILYWLGSIGETDQELIKRVVERCETDEISKGFFVEKARDVLARAS